MDDDIGSFGLPFGGGNNNIGGDRTARGASKGRKRPRPPAALSKAKGRRGVRRPMSAMLRDVNDNDGNNGDGNEESCSDDDDDVALSQLTSLAARHSVQKKKKATTIKTITPSASSSSTATSMSASSADGNKRCSAASDARSKKSKKKQPTRQLGIHSFLSKASKAANAASLVDSRGDNAEQRLSSATSSERSTAVSSGDGGGDTAGPTNNPSGGDKRRKVLPGSFVTAATALATARTADSNNCTVVNGADELLKFDSDADSNVSDAKDDVIDNGNSSLGDDKEDDVAPLEGRDGKRTNATELGYGAKEEAREKRKRLRRRNHIAFGVQPCNLGYPHILPVVNEINGDEIDGSWALTDQQRTEERRLLHGKCGSNVLSALFRRSTLPSNSNSTSSIRSQLVQYAHRGDHCDVSASVELSSTCGGGGGEVTAMQFDNEGVLLATGDDRGRVNVYDFDDVYMLDGRRRNEICKESWESCGGLRDGRYDDSVDENKGGEGSDAEEAGRSGVDEGDCVARSANNGDGDESDGGGQDEQQRQPTSSTVCAITTAIKPAAARPVLSFQCKARAGGGSNGAGPRIGGVLWSPMNQDHLVVSFA